jgi:MscS family membrane protein
LEIIKEILKDHEGLDEEFPPRIFFNDFNDYSLNILMLYWYHPPDYWAFLAFNEKVNMEMLERFNAEGIEFAFPTQTVYVANDERRQLALRMLEKGTDIHG